MFMIRFCSWCEDMIESEYGSFESRAEAQQYLDDNNIDSCAFTDGEEYEEIVEVISGEGFICWPANYEVDDEGKLYDFWLKR